ncbi:hypothetical protein [Salegentibacter sp. Hel_I_6]|uniref:hypothetical protein n=1 Tax=Salegentibacter sp. Hel_I_6 TaxID=1250278 RepID=UPI0012E03DBC|nr:hypothetical protein [Salegentibacter sp. Hel_I_6]
MNSIYAPNQLNDSFSAEESWEIHKAAYIKQLKSRGLPDNEIKKSMVTYEKNKEEFIARVKEQYRLAAIQRKKAFEQRALMQIEREKAAEHRKLAAVQRQKAEELRRLANLERKKAEEQRGKDTGQREKANELRKQAEIERAKAEEQRKLAEIQREKARAQRMKVQEWRDSAETILLKNITLSSHSDNNKPIAFKVTSKGSLKIGIRAHISLGNTLIEIYNPQGSKEGELSLKFNSKSGSDDDRDEVEFTSGALDKTISDTELGEWQIKISSQRSEGTVAMSVLQYIKPTIDE